MKQERLVKVQRLPRDPSKYAIIGQKSGCIFFEGTRFQCCSEIGHCYDMYEDHELDLIEQKTEYPDHYEDVVSVGQGGYNGAK